MCPPLPTPVRPGLEPLEDRLALDAAGPAPPDPHAANPSRILVRFRPGLDDQTLAPAVAGTTVGPALGLVPGLREVSLDSGVGVAGALAAYRADPRVLSADPDYLVRVRRTPNDPNLGAQWNLQNTGQLGGKADADIDAPQAWDVTTGTGRTVVAVIDSGIDYTHPDLAANVWTNPGEIPGNGIDDDHNGYVDDVHGYDFVDDTGDPMDDNGHGTEVAGVIGAVGDNGIGVAGVDWHVKLMALKFLDANGDGYTSDAIRALNYAVKMGASISNNSWGDDSYNPLLAQAIANARAAGHIFVVAAGNDGTNTDATPTYPTDYASDNVVAVAGTDQSDNLAWFSDYGPRTVELAAPAVDVLSTQLHGAYGYDSGTSMAAPEVTGVLALVRDQHPDWTYQQVIRQVLATVDPLPALRGKVATGGRLNAAAAVRPVVADATPPRVLSAVWSGSSTASLSKVRLTFSEPIDPSTFTPADVLSFTGPWGDLKVSGVAAVADSDGRQFDVSFVPQGAAGTYQMVIGPDVRDLAGLALDQDGDGRPGERGQDAFTTSANLGNALSFYQVSGYPIRDFQTTTSTITVPQDATIADLDVRLHISHSQDRDLRVVLRAPWGQEVVLIDGRGGTGDNFHYTTLDDEAAVSIAAGKPPFTGSFRPEQPLSALDGRNARGTWQLMVTDRAAYGVGTLHYWMLQITLPPVAATARRASLLAASLPGAAEASSPAPEALQAAAAVYDQDLSGDEGGGVAGQEDDRPDHVRRLTVPPQGDVAGQFLVGGPVLEQGRAEARLDQARRDGVDSHA